MRRIVKVFIWIGAVIVYVIAEEIFQAIFIGFRMGWLLRYAFVCLMIYIGRKLSARWDMHCLEKQASKEGKSRKEYLIDHTPKFIIDICESQHSASSIEEMLKPHIREKLITRTVAKALAEEFGRKYVPTVDDEEPDIWDDPTILVNDREKGNPYLERRDN